MELNENYFILPTGNTQFFNNLKHFHFQHPQQQVDHFSMSYIQSPQPQPQPQPQPHQSVPSAELCQKVSGKSGYRKRKRGNKGAEEARLNPSDMIHVRAKRGQATDSHSLAERVRRKKINEKLKSLQDIVPGCHQTMGMAVMLDVVIKYIQSLQNQIEFLSMKLLAASLLHDLNSSEMEAAEIMQAPQQNADVQEMERFGTEGYGGEAPYVNSIFFPQENI